MKTMKFWVSLGVIGMLLFAGCKSKKDTDKENTLLLILLGASSRHVGDGCNFKTKFTICVPPGIGGE